MTGVNLDDEFGVFRKLIEMLSGEATIVRRVELASLRPPLERDPTECNVALPEQIEQLPSKALNRSYYRFLALQLAGRREFQTYPASGPPLVDRLRVRPGIEQPSALEQLFLLAEGVRIQARIARSYPGTAAETAELATAVVAAWKEQPRPTLAGVCDVLLSLALAPGDPPAWLPRATAEQVVSALSAMQHSRATAVDSLALARRLLAFFSTPVFSRGLTLTRDDPAPEPKALGLSELVSDGGAIGEELVRAGQDAIPGPLAAASDSRAKLERAGTGAADSGSNAAEDASGEPDAVREDAEPDPAAGVRLRRVHRAAASGQTFLYDEWDHRSADYRHRYCRVHEIARPNDSTALYERTRLAYAPVLGRVRHQFERIRPERYRPLRGLEHGEDLDWSALIEARVETRAQRTPNTRVYTARTRQQRDVATLFLVDLSASTEQPYAEPGEPQPHRIIDTLKEALVVMSSALQDLGDSYAIYGFSSHGRDRVEVYPVKAFDEPLSPEVKARIGSMAPKNGTRMGAALRHVSTKFRATQARSKHLILLSDGFPQDQEYGPDRRSYTYGIQDTAVALRELDARGVTPFCITVDRAGNDYLREMCAPEQYMIIEHLEDLPAELPKIYRRVVQS